MKKSMEELQKEHDEAVVKWAQYQHQVQRLENRIRDQREAERKRRRHHLIISADKYRKARGGGRSWKRQWDAAAIFA